MIHASKFGKVFVVLELWKRVSSSWRAICGACLNKALGHLVVFALQFGSGNFQEDVPSFRIAHPITITEGKVQLPRPVAVTRTVVPSTSYGQTAPLYIDLCDDGMYVTRVNSCNSRAGWKLILGR